MEQVPKIVTQRLNAAKAGAHPDPNLLTALVEQSLTEPERVQVLAHMAQCADCRDIVAVSLPEFEMAPAAAAAPAKSRWLSWRVLRWSAAAVCVVVVGAAVSLHKQASMVQEAPRSPSAVPEKAAATPSSAAPAAPGPAESNRDLSAAPAAGKKLAANMAPAPISAAQQPARDKGGLTAAPALSKQLGAPEAASRADNRPSTPPVSQMADAVSPSAQSGELDKKEAQATEQAEASSARSDDRLASTPAPALEVAQATTGKAKDASQKAKAPAPGMVGGAMTANAKLARSEAAQNELKSNYVANLVLPRWTLSSDGSLQRSLDAGKTWQTIPVPGNVTFRALAAVGVEIWVGGAKGALCHSSDAGEHWVQVQPVADGKPLTSDIIGVEFTDARHGKLTTTSGETWTTTDGGQTWSKK